MRALMMGIDPSFRNLSTSTLTDDKKIHITWDGLELGNTVDFGRAHLVADKLTNRVVSKIKKKFTTVEQIIVEVPPPNSQYSAGLFALDSLLMYKCRVFLKPSMMYTLSASFLTHLHGTDKYSKKDSRTLALHFIDVLTEWGYEVIINDRTLNNDMAEALLFMLKGICIDNTDNLKEKVESELGTFMGEYYKELEVLNVNSD
ncbi:MAG: hypothetical protein ACRC0R_00120 [Cetobacterium sp.]